VLPAGPSVSSDKDAESQRWCRIYRARPRFLALSKTGGGFGSGKGSGIGVGYKLMRPTRRWRGTRQKAPRPSAWPLGVLFHRDVPFRGHRTFVYTTFNMEILTDLFNRAAHANSRRASAAAQLSV
jgi:hypothetical protein